MNSAGARLRRAGFVVILELEFDPPVLSLSGWILELEIALPGSSSRTASAPLRRAQTGRLQSVRRVAANVAAMINHGP